MSFPKQNLRKILKIPKLFHLKAKFIKEKDHKKKFILNQSVIFKLISMVYLEGLKKIRKHEKTEDLSVLIYEFFVKRYGLKSIAVAKLLQLLNSCI